MTTPIQAPHRPGSSAIPTPTSLAHPAAADPAPAGPLAELAVPAPSDTPRLLRRLQVLAALALLLLGAVSTWVVMDLRSDLASAPGLTDQYARIGQVQAALVDANTTARKGVIAGNGRPSSQADEVGARLGTASGLLVEAARARGEDAAALVAISDHLVQYGHLLRAADGRDETTAAGFLAKADAQLDEELLPALEQLQDALSDEAHSRRWSQSPTTVQILGLVVLAGLGWISWIVARRSRRILNVGLVGALGCTVVVMWVTGAAQQSATQATEQSRGVELTNVVSLTDSINQASAAQRLQATGVQRRSWSAANADALDAAIAAASQGSPATADGDLERFRAASAALTALIAKPDWAAAEKALLSTADAGLAMSSHAFTGAVDTERAAAVTRAAATPDDARTALAWQLAIVIAAAVGGAALAGFGLQQRLREYR